MAVSSLPKTVIRQRRECDLNSGPSAPESSTLTARLPSHPNMKPICDGATENARPENAGLENNGQLRKESQGLENAGLENDGQHLSKL